MASDTAYSPSPLPTAAPEENHRKRRRNRTRVSCLNCYASKRKCDRKRPCTRCIKHNLTGLCFYELDDPTARDDPDVDEATRLRRRIAELESVVRAMNNRPHPRWTAPGGVTHRAPPPRTRTRRTRAASTDIDAFFAAEADEDAEPKVKLEQETLPPEFTPSDSEGASPPAHSPFGSPLTPLLSVSDEPEGDAGPSRTDPDCRSPASVSSDEGLPLAQIFSVCSHTSAAIQTSPTPPPTPPPTPCDCLAAATLHSPLVYFASALRTSREALESSHTPGSTCVLFRRILELDEHIFSAAPPSPPPLLDFANDDVLNFVTPPPLQGSPSPPPLPHIHLSPFQHSETIGFLDYPSLYDWA